MPSAVQQMLQDCMQHLAAMGLDGRFGLQLDVLPPSFGREAGKQAAGEALKFVVHAVLYHSLCCVCSNDAPKPWR